MSKTHIDAQLNVLACLMTNPYGIQEQAEGLTVDHFPSCMDMADAILNHKLEIRGKAKEFKGMDLANLTGDERAVDLYMYEDNDSYETSRQILLKTQRKKKAAKLAHDINNSDGSMESLMDFSQRLAELTQENPTEDPKICNPAAKLLDQVLKGETVGGDPMPCSLPALAKIIGGWVKGRYYFIGGRPGMGKTSFALQEAIAMAKAGHGGSIFSLEMTKEDLTMRMASQVAEVNAEKVREGNLSEKEKESYVKALNEVGSLPINIYDEPNFRNVDNVYGRSVIDMRKEGIEWVVVDYIGLMAPSKKEKVFGSNKNDLLAALSSKLFNLKKFGLAVIVLSQLSRKVEERADKEPQLSDLRDSGALEQDADAVIFPVQYEYYNMVNPYDGSDEDRIFVKKNRFGTAAAAAVSWVGKYTKYTEVQSGGNIQTNMSQIGGNIAEDTYEDAPF